VLDALAAELHQEFLNLAAALACFLVQRDADQAVRRAHRLGSQAGVLAVDVEVADLLEVEELRVEVGPVRHAAAIDVVCEVIDDREAVAFGTAIHTG